MKNTDEVMESIDCYLDECFLLDKRPTFNGLAKYLGTSTSTIQNVYRGSYNGHPYTNKPHPTRIISNTDFELIRKVFSGKENE